MSRRGGTRDPLEALQRVRGLSVDEAEAQLRDALAIVTEREGEVETATDAHAALEVDHGRERAAQRAREDAGGSARDLSLGQAYLGRRELELKASLTAVRAAEAALGRARALADERQAVLAATRADAEVVERHLERQEGAEKRARSARAEADVEDLVAARRPRREG